MFKVALPILLFLFVGVAMVSDAFACSCGGPGPVDWAYEESPNIAILKLRSLEKYPDSQTEETYSVGNIKQSILTVEKVFKGNLKVGQKLAFRQGGGGDCVWTFSEKAVGNEYLLYLSAKPGDDGLWTGEVCSRSGSTKYRASDLLYLEKLPKVLGKTRISGRLVQQITTAVEGGYRESKLLADRFVWITGNGNEIKLKTDENGVYEVYDLSPGKYIVRPENLVGYKIETYAGAKQDFIEVDLKPRSHEEVDFDFEIDNSIKGKVVDANGSPVSFVCLDLEPTDGKLAPYTYLVTCTKEGGIFEFDEIPAGTYVIVVNKEGKINGDHPFGRFYYPNRLERAEAAQISIGSGEHHAGLILTAPETLDTVVYSGRVVFEDGKPVPNEFVNFVRKTDVPRSRNYNPDINTKTSENGEFSIKLVKGSKGYIFGSFITFSGEYERCPKLEKLIKASGSSVPTLETPAVEVDPVTDVSGIELRFPFPSCKRSKID